MAGQGDFRRIPGGLPGVETRGILLYSEGVTKGRISEQTLCRVLSENPAKLYGLYPRKGVIAPGSDGDVVVLDPAGKTVLHGEALASAAGYTPFEGMELSGRIREVYLRGRKTVEGGTLLEKNRGVYLRRGKNCL